MNYLHVLDVILTFDIQSRYWIGRSCKEHKEGSLWGHWFFFLFFLTKYDDTNKKNGFSRYYSWLLDISWLVKCPFQLKGPLY